MTTAAFTKRVILGVQRAFPRAKLSRMNVGGAVPMDRVRIAMGYIERGDIRAARSILSRPTAFGVAGLPDICGLLPVSDAPLGILMGIEVKCGRDYQTKQQKVCQRVFAQAGAIYVIADDKTGVDGCVGKIRDWLKERGL